MSTPPTRPPAIYCTDALDAPDLSYVDRSLALRTDLPVQHSHISHAMGSSHDACFYLVPADLQLPIPPTPFAPFDWPTRVEFALYRSLVLTTAEAFVRAAHAGELHELHAQLFRAQHYHRACVALSQNRRRSDFALSLNGLVVSMPATQMCAHDLCTQLSIASRPVTEQKGYAAELVIAAFAPFRTDLQLSLAAPEPA